MDGVDDAVFVVEPEFVAPAFRVAVCVARGVVVDCVPVLEVFGKGGFCCFCWREDGHFVLRFLVLGFL